MTETPMTPTHQLARFIALGGGSPEERAFFESLCQSFPEVEAVYQTVLSAQAAEAESALEEAHPTVILDFLTGNMDSSTGSTLARRLLAGEEVVVEGMRAVLRDQPGLWANADRRAHFLPLEDQLRLSWVQVALSHIARSQWMRVEEGVPALFADRVRLLVDTEGVALPASEVEPPASFQIGLQHPLVVLLASLVGIENWIGWKAQLTIGEGSEVLAEGVVDEAGVVELLPVGTLVDICSIFPNNTMDMGYLVGLKRQVPLRLRLVPAV